MNTLAKEIEALEMELSQPVTMSMFMSPYDMALTLGGERQQVAERLSALRQRMEGDTEIETMQRDAELWQKHGPAIRQMLAALDILSPLVLTRLKLQDAADGGSSELRITAD